MDIVGEGLDAHGLAKNRKDKEEQVVRLLETVGLQAERKTVFLMNFRVDRDSVWELHVLWQ